MEKDLVIEKLEEHDKRLDKHDAEIGDLKIRTAEEIILKYKNWLKITNSEDKIENYEEFLRSQ